MLIIRTLKQNAYCLIGFLCSVSLETLFHGWYEIGEYDGAIEDKDRSKPVEDGELVLEVQNREDQRGEFAESHDECDD